MEDASTVLQADFGGESQTIPGETQRALARPVLRPVLRRSLPKDRPAAIRDVEIALDADLFLRVSLGCITVLMVLGLLAAYAFVSEAGLPRLVVRALLLDAEANLPTFFAFGLLVFSSALLALIGICALLARQRFRFHWALLGALFLLAAFDEAAGLHERLIQPVRAALDTSGALHFAWVIPGGALVASLALFYLRFLRELPAPFGRLFVLAGVLYLTGALGVEMLGSAFYEASGKQAFPYQIITVAEETLEMLGAAVFAYALMRFLAHQSGKVCLRFSGRLDESAGDTGAKSRPPAAVACPMPACHE